jgi:predicted amidophosphoribosyltransferase
MMPIARKVTLEDIERMQIPVCEACGKRLHELTPVCRECRDKEPREAEGD